MNCQARTKSPIDHCVGCTACLKVCKHNALSMGKDEQGFYVALKNEQCTSCGDCTSFCAHRNDVKSFLKRRKKPKTYAAWSKNNALHQTGNSGGLFSTIALKWIEEGNVVAAPVYNEEFVPQYILANTAEMVEKQAWSKFVQSEVGDIYSQIQKVISNGKKVLFVGAPCQVKGLYAYLGEDHSALLTVQFPCIGMPVQWFYQDYLKDLTGKNLSEIREVYGEVLDAETQKRVMKCVTSQGEVICEAAHSSVYVKAWNTFLTVNDACCRCTDNIAPVCADFTWGNFWYLGSIKPLRVDFEKYKHGCSMLLCHSEKADSFFSELYNDIETYERSYTEAASGHTMFQSSATKHLLMKKYVNSERRKNFQNQLRYRKYDALKQDFFEKTDAASLNAAAKVNPKFKGYIWRMLYYVQKVLNRL